MAMKLMARSSDYTAHIRSAGLLGETMAQAVNKELQRLQTDYIDLYQIHWPERITNTFGVRDYVHTTEDERQNNFNEVLHKLDAQVKAGKINQLAISNEKSWGTRRFLEES